MTLKTDILLSSFQEMRALVYSNAVDHCLQFQ